MRRTSRAAEVSSADVSSVMKQSYRSDLTDEQWEVIRTLIPAAKTGGRPRTVEMRGVINGIFYILVAGCAWCLLPHDFPKWKTVYHYFRQWRINGDWERIHEQLRKWVRAIEDRHPSPSAAVLDNQSVKTATMIHTEVGYDCAKQIKGTECTARQALEFNSREPGGRKRHVLVDTLGLLIVVVVTAANLPERAGAKLVFAQVKKERRRFWRLVKIWVDGGYRGEEFMKWVMDTYRWILETILRSDNQKKFKILPRRWVVERTFGWFNWCRRLNKDYEVLPATSETIELLGNKLKKCFKPLICKA